MLVRTKASMLNNAVGVRSQAGNELFFPPLTSTPLGVMMPTRRQPDKLDAASNNFCSICTLNVDHTEFGIDPRITP